MSQPPFSTSLAYLREEVVIDGGQPRDGRVFMDTVSSCGDTKPHVWVRRLGHQAEANPTSLNRRASPFESYVQTKTCTRKRNKLPAWSPHPDMRSLSPPVSCHWRDALEMLNSAETHRKGRREYSVSVRPVLTTLGKKGTQLFSSRSLADHLSGVFKAGRERWPGTDVLPQ